ncbi:MAG TPA: GIY-YIG nuclease family protein [Stellaceae bacterium]|nr:GIY-YIG nuclease family protein [Stellaceae bacterium]
MFYVYILASKPHGTLYVGSTSNLVRRVWEHKIKAVPGFTARSPGLPPGMESIDWSGTSAMRRWKRECCGRGVSRNGSAPGKYG